MATERIFGELAALAAIPSTSYSVGEEVDGAMCLLETASGFEVFSAAGGARHEIRVFSDEESACFYLFGLLAAEAVRTGGLVPGADRAPAPAGPAPAAANGAGRGGAGPHGAVPNGVGPQGASTVTNPPAPVGAPLR